MMTRLTRGLSALTLLAGASCADPGPSYPEVPPDVVGTDRPADVFRPVDYDPDVAYPLVVLLHGYGANGFVQDLFFGAGARVDALQFVLVTPNGTVDPGGKLYWNAGACCGFGPNPPDDVSYLVDLVEEVARTHHIDRRRVYALGHSNGGAMALRLACDAPEVFTAVGSLAGIASELESTCTPSNTKVSVLTIHGDSDDTVLYDGDPLVTGIVKAPYPSAPETIERFARRLGCDTTAAQVGTDFDLTVNPAGPETTPTVYTQGCAAGTRAEHWRIAAGEHIPFFTADGQSRTLSWLLDRRR